MKRIARRATLPLVLGIVVLLAPAGAGATDRRAERTRPGYDREDVRRPQVKRSPARSLPDALRIEQQGPIRKQAEASALARDAALAASWAATEVVEQSGRREYYRVGFHAGMRAALEDDTLGRWDFDEGMCLGRRDHQARRAGAVEGGAAAREAASTAAREQVERQFMDLGREPHYAPFRRVPEYFPQDRWAVPPALDEVFAETPIPRSGGLAERFADAFHDGRYDPWALNRCKGHAAFFDEGWDER